MDVPRRNPSEFLKQLLGKPVVVRLTSGVDYRGAENTGGGGALALALTVT
jgi:hypothetical protein